MNKKIKFVVILIFFCFFITGCTDPAGETGFCELNKDEVRKLQAIIDHSGWGGSSPPSLDEVLQSCGIIFGDGCSTRLENGGIYIEGGGGFVAEIEKTVCSDFILFESWLLDYLTDETIRF